MILLRGRYLYGALLGSCAAINVRFEKNSDKCVCHLGSPWPRISADGDKVDDDCSESEMEKADDHVE